MPRRSFALTSHTPAGYCVFASFTRPYTISTPFSRQSPVLGTPLLRVQRSNAPLHVVILSLTLYPADKPGNGIIRPTRHYRPTDHARSETYSHFYCEHQEDQNGVTAGFGQQSLPHHPDQFVPDIAGYHDENANRSESKEDKGGVPKQN